MCIYIYIYIYIYSVELTFACLCVVSCLCECELACVRVYLYAMSCLTREGITRALFLMYVYALHDRTVRVRAYGLISRPVRVSNSVRRRSTLAASGWPRHFAPLALPHGSFSFARVLSSRLSLL